VEGLLKRAGIPTGEGYEVSQPLDAQPVDGMQITVDTYFVNEETYTVETPFEISTVEDPYMVEGDERIVTEGVVGQSLYTATVTYRNSEEIKRTVTNKEVIRASQNQVVAVGTGELVGKKAEKPLIGDDVIVLPTGEVLTYYKKDTYKATAYTKYDEGCNDTTACMTKVKWGVVAVDTDLIPYGTRMYIMTSNGKFIYGIGTAEDCGGAIQGKRLDLYMPTLREAFKFGRQDVTVYFLGDANWHY
jgi:3D (Asp-Asp-Asp) domain-containing protein